MSLPNPCTRCATELNSFRGYWCYRNFVIIIIIKEEGSQSGYHTGPPKSMLLNWNHMQHPDIWKCSRPFTCFPVSHFCCICTQCIWNLGLKCALLQNCKWYCGFIWYCLMMMMQIQIFIRRSSNESATLGYLWRGSVEIQRGGRPHSLYTKGYPALY